MKGYRNVKFARSAEAVFSVLDPENQENILAVCDQIDKGATPDQMGGEPIKNQMGMFAIKIGETFRLVLRLPVGNTSQILVAEILNYYFFDQYYRKS